MDATKLLLSVFAAALALGGTQAMAAVSLNLEFDDSLAPDSSPTEPVNYLFVSPNVLANGATISGPLPTRRRSSPIWCDGDGNGR